MPLFQKAVFHTTVARLSDLPADSQGEVAFAGRSNAGKSSAINTLANHSRLAFVSKTPGRTQHLNFFLLDEGRYLVDLPGYGFAKAPGEIRAQWDGLLAPYLRFRLPLLGMVLIVDSRQLLTELDEQMLAWFAPTGKPVHILLSKADKLTRMEQARALSGMKESLRHIGDSEFAGRCTVQLFSSLKKTGVETAEAVLAGWYGIEPVAAKAPPVALRTEKKARPRKRSAQGWSARSAAVPQPVVRARKPSAEVAPAEVLVETLADALPADAAPPPADESR